MRSPALLLLACALAPLASAASYSYSIYNAAGSPVEQSDLTNWNANSGATNGSVSCGGGGGAPCPISSSSAGSLIYTKSAATAYEVSLGLDTSFLIAGGGVQIYLHASSNALRSASGTSDQGTFDVISLYSPACATDGSCTINMSYYERSGTTTTLKAYSVMPFLTGARVRAVAYGTSIGLLVDNTYIGFASGLSGGYPGTGASGGGGIDTLQIGPQCTTVPTVVSSSNMAISAYPNSVSLTWTEPSQPADVEAVGIVTWYCARNSAWYGSTYTAAAWTDPNASPSTGYTYSVAPVSFHGIAAPWSTPISVTTPSADNIDPRRTGVKPLGTYWGASPEQIDAESGNLNLTVPVLQAQGRGGWTVPISLSYNSQNWKQDSAGVQMESRDVGFGQGWRMMAGSLTPYWNSQTLLIDHYLYIDSTGAEYRLYQMSTSTPNIWTSQLYPGQSGEAIYVYYDSSAGLLHFRDGSFWVMGCTSSGEEPDAGSMYPTVIEDRNGNQVLMGYASGVNTTYLNSSARIATIADTRAVSVLNSYVFTYGSVNASGVPHLNSIANYIGTDESYSFSYTGSPLTITDPFVGGSYPNITELTNVTDQINFTRQFNYDAHGNAAAFELPNGGYLRWTYTTNTYTWTSPANTIVQQAVSARYLATASNSSTTLNGGTDAPEWQYNLTYAAPASGQSVIPSTCLTDVTAQAERCWSFSTGQGYSWVGVIGLVTDIYRYNAATGAQLRVDILSYWSDPAGNPYVSYDVTADTTGPSTVYSQRQVSLDEFGNVTGSWIWDWSTTYPSTSSGWKRTYASTFQNACSSPFTGSTGSNCNYVNKFILNLLSSQTLTDSSKNTVALQTNTYDNYSTHALASVTGLTEFDSSYNASYTLRGNLTQSVVPASTTNTYYDQTGMPTGSDDNNGHAISVTAASGTNNSAPGVIQPNTGNSMDGNLATSLTYSTFLGVSSATAPNSSLTTVAYDSLGRPLTAVAATGASTGYVYAFGTTTTDGSIANGPYTTTATTNTHWSTSITDGLGRTANVQSGYLTGSVSTPVSQVDTIYAPCACSATGKMSEVSQPYLPGGTRAYTVYGYDAVGRTLSVTLPDNASKTTYLYQGNWTTVTDPAGNWKQYESDVFGNTIEVVEPDPSYTPLTTTPPATPGTGNGILVTNYIYDFVNHLTNVSMTRAGVTQTRTSTYSSTTLQLMSTTSPETGTATANGTASYAYNADGTLYTRTDAKGQVTTYSYDSYQRVITVTHGTDATQTYNYTYDQGTNGYGRLTQVTWGGMCGGFVAVYTESYSYTVAGEMSGKTLSVTKRGTNGGCYQIPITGSFTYDNEGKATGITYPEFTSGVTAPSVAYSYDNLSRLIGVTDNNELGVAQCTGGAGSVVWASGGAYNAAGQMVGVKRLQSVSGCAPAAPQYFNQAWQYNSLNQLTEIDTSAQSNGYPEGVPIPGAATYFFAKYGFSATANNGQITSMQDARTGSTVSYTYDSLKRVTGATGSGGSMLSQTFGYDGFGNLTSKSVPAGSSEFVLPGVNAAKNWLNGSTYDQNGNVATLNNATLSYDVENRLSEYTTGSFVENYAYDEANRRVDKFSSGADNVYFYGPNGKLLTVVQVNFLASAPYVTMTTVSNRIYFGGMLLGTYNGYANLDSDVMRDRLGSVQPSFAYGTATGFGTQATADGDDFATYLKDTSTGFEYAMNRYYSTGYGRFLTVDPFGGSAKAGSPMSWNRYAYGSGDPVNRFDPSGLCSSDSGGDDYVGSCYCPPEQQYCGQGPPGTDYGLNDISALNCGSSPQFVDGDADETLNSGDGCGAPIVPPPPPPPSCSISEYARSAGGQHRPWYHTYLVINDPLLEASGYLANTLILQAGPSNNAPFGGTLTSQIALPGTGFGSNKNNASNPAAGGNTEIGAPDTNSYACLDIILLLEAIANYKQSRQVPYMAVPIPFLTYNSNSFTSTLLYDIGLSFGSPGFAPGWGPLYRVPGLVP